MKKTGNVETGIPYEVKERADGDTVEERANGDTVEERADRDTVEERANGDTIEERADGILYVPKDARVPSES